MRLEERIAILKSLPEGSPVEILPSLKHSSISLDKHLWAALDEGYYPIIGLTCYERIINSFHFDSIRVNVLGNKRYIPCQYITCDSIKTLEVFDGEGKLDSLFDRIFDSTFE